MICDTNLLMLTITNLRNGTQNWQKCYKISTENWQKLIITFWSLTASVLENMTGIVRKI